MNISRREMLKLMAASGAALAMPPWARPALAEPRVLAFKGNAAACVRKLIESFGGMKRFVSRHDKVVIKPNLGFAVPPERASNTNPVIIHTLAQMALEAGAKNVQVLDNPAHPPLMCGLRNGIKDALKDLDDVHVELLRDEEYFAEVEIPNGKKMKTAKVMKAILECDALFNAPIAKSHGGAMVTFGLKNWMGAVQDRGAWHRTYGLHQAIADFATYIKPKLTILDATRILTTNGPGGPGEIKVLDTVIGGFDMVAVDSWAVTLSTWDGKTLTAQDVPHIRRAAQMGVGSMDLADLVIPAV